MPDRSTSLHGDARVLLAEGVDAPRDIPWPIVQIAARAYLRDGVVDMQAIARELDIGRATVYRRAGNKDRLLGSIMWWRARIMLADALEVESGRVGADRVAAINEHLLEETHADVPLQRLLGQDPTLALRVLTGTDGRVQLSVARFFEALIRMEIARGNFRSGMDVSALSYALVRLDESFLYSDLIAARERNMVQAKAVTRALLMGVSLLPST